MRKSWVEQAGRERKGPEQGRRGGAGIEGGVGDGGEDIHGEVGMQGMAARGRGAGAGMEERGHRRGKVVDGEQGGTAGRRDA